MAVTPAELKVSLGSRPFMDLPDALHGLTPERLAQLAGAHITTARRWLRRRQAPRVILAALAVLRYGDLGAVSGAWSGWLVRGAELVSPEGSTYTPSMVRAGPLYERAAAELRAQVQACMAAAESGAERMERVAALAALVEAQAAARAALDALSASLTPPERARLFASLDSTRLARERLALTE